MKNKISIEKSEGYASNVAYHYISFFKIELGWIKSI